MIELKHVSKVFETAGGRVEALKDISLTIPDGDVYGIIGMSGAGKSTLVRCINMLERPTSGEVIVNGKRLDTMSPAQLRAARRDITMIFQRFNLLMQRNCLDNVCFPMELAGVSRREAASRAQELLETVGLPDKAKAYPAQLSGGQQQRVAIARAFVNNPKLLLLDEPLSALDYKLRQEMQIELKELQKELGITFIYVTHNQEEALSMSDRVTVLNEGIIEQTGTPSEIYEEPCNMFVAKFVGEINAFDGMVVKEDENGFDTVVEGMFYTLRKPKTFEVRRGQKIKVLLRPEDMVVSKADDPEADAPENALRGVISFLVYKGMTIDLWIKTASDNMIMATQFFNEDDPEIDYAVGDVVNVSWIKDWEVILPDV